MKIGKKRSNSPDIMASSSTPAKNQSKKSTVLIVIIIITAILITWVYLMGKKATDTVTVCMTATSVYKNQQITEDMLQPYDMIKAEFDKYAIVNSDGSVSRRVLLWDERGIVIGSYAAFPMLQNTVCEYRSFYTYKVDNTDSVLYNFPGKEVMSLDIATNDLQTFKTFLQPGDRVTVTAIYKEEEDVTSTDAFGGTVTQTVETIRTETVFKDILVADLLNSTGDSILDIYADYNGRSVTQQAALDASAEFQDSVEPANLIVALTPEEKELYYYYLSKNDVEFRMALPQRVD